MFTQSKARSHFMLQLIALGYIAYTIFGMIKLYLSGTEELSPFIFVLMIVIMGAAEVALAFFAVRGWLRDRKKEQENADFVESSGKQINDK